jgi:hypothetical protein
MLPLTAMFELAVGVSRQPPPGHTPLFRREIPGGDRRRGLARRVEPLGMKREIGELARRHHVFGRTRHQILDDPKLFRGSHGFMASQTSAVWVESSASAFDEICIGTDSFDRPRRPHGFSERCNDWVGREPRVYRLLSVRQNFASRSVRVAIRCHPCWRLRSKKVTNERRTWPRQPVSS